MKSRLLQLFTLLYLPYAIFVVLGGVYTYQGEETRERERIEARESHELDLAARNMQTSLEGIFTDILYLANDPSILDAAGQIPTHALTHVEEHLSAFLAAKNAYERVRWIDTQGRERIRVDKQGAQIVVVPSTHLQDKSDRYYVTRTLNSQRGEIYVSALDLQIDNGKVVEPHRPLIRVATPIYNRDAERLGNVVINFEGRDLIRSFMSAMPAETSDHAYLLDAQANLLRSPDNHHDWGHLLGRDDGFDKRHPDIWRQVSGKRSGQFFADSGLWTYRNYTPGEGGLHEGNLVDHRVTVERPFILVSHVPTAEFHAQYRNAQLKIGGSVIVLLLTGFVGSLMLAFLWNQRESGRAEMERLGERDTLLTNLGEGVIGTDPSGHCMFANPAACQLLDQDPALIRGQGIGDLIDFREELTDEGQESRNLLADPEMLKQRQEHTGLLRMADGRRTPVLLTIVPLPPTPGNLAVVITLQDITELRNAQAKAYRLAFFDTLTNLPNRRTLLDHLALALATQERTHGIGALIFIDIDQFNMINKAHGQDVGDQVLIEFSRLLGRLWRKEDTVSHLGGDHYIVLMQSLASTPEDAVSSVDNATSKLIMALKQGLKIGDRTLPVTVSIGVTLLDDPAVAPDVLVTRGEMAMYQAKEAGRNALRFFDPIMQARVDSQIAMEAEIRDGLARNEFLPYYQAKVDCSGRLVSVEALCRWQHSSRGLVAPDEFIPVAESSGLIMVLGFQILHRACQQLASWAGNPASADISIAVNASARQFSNPQFVAEVCSVLEDTGARPDRLIIELTESLLAENLQDVIAKMESLRAIGVRFSLDDFGTGYSSLSYLKRLPVHEIKIDRAFIREVDKNENDRSLVRAIIAMGHSLGIKIVAEGVETEAQCDLLRREQCDLAQGYLFGKPMPVEELARHWFH